MATLDQIVRFGQQPSPLIQGLQSLVPAAQAIGDARRRNNRQEAANLLGKAFSDEVSDPAEIDALRAQARELDPEYTLQIEQAVAKRARDMQATPYQQETLALNREKLLTRQQELAERATDRELKREELKLKTEQRKQKLEQEKKAAELSETKAEDTRTGTIDLVNRMLDHPGLESAVGLSSVAPTIPGGEAADFEVLLDTLKGRQFLTEIQKMKGQGSLSDAEGKKIEAAAESLSLSQSEEAFKDALNRIKEGLETIKPAGTYSTEKNNESSETVINWNDM